MKKKRDQKKLGNKGFSLVELIVVIAIMAILVGVLAPVLIKNIEKSRESKDMQNLDSVKGAVTQVLANENCYEKLVPASGTASYTLDSSNKVLSSAGTELDATVTSEFQSILGTSGITMSSKNAKTGKLTIKVDNKGQVIVGVYGTDGNVLKGTIDTSLEFEVK